MTPEAAQPHPGVSRRAFALLVAGIMGISALGVDLMLPALPAISAHFGLDNPNRAQLVITLYSLGFGLGQPVWGPITDRYGRKRVLAVALTGFAVTGLAAFFAGSFVLLALARLVQGLFAAATRVLVHSIVRDCYSGAKMAAVMSSANTIFFAIPILAPALGALILLGGDWAWTFGALSVGGLALLGWTTLRLPETLPPAARRPVSWPAWAEAALATVRDRQSRGYALAGSFMFGAVLAYVNSSEQIIREVFDAGRLFPLVFAGIAVCMGLANLFNARFVERLGPRRISHSALAALVAFSGTHAALAMVGHETLVSFVVLQSLSLAAIGLTGSSFASLAMMNLGRFAGTAASLQGFVGSVGAALIGLVIGQAYDGTTVPLSLGTLAAALAALLTVWWTERRQ